MKRAALVLLSVLAGGVAHAALVDSYLARRVVEVAITCPATSAAGADVCTLEVLAVRPLSAQALAEATAAGIDISPLREASVRREVTRAAVNTLVAASSVAR